MVGGVGGLETADLDARPEAGGLGRITWLRHGTLGSRVLA